MPTKAATEVATTKTELPPGKHIKDDKQDCQNCDHPRRDQDAVLDQSGPETCDT